MGRTLTKARVAEPARVLTDLQAMGAAGLRATIELRGLGMHDTADALCEVIDQMNRVRLTALARLAEAEPLKPSNTDSGNCTENAQEA